ncbi:MAG: alpha/beta hydrolase, partial [Alphaproteobacteria bacterium]|nr:alpha/beta hydrolase [Alphaproteobacteria bacterium]
GGAAPPAGGPSPLDYMHVAAAPPPPAVQAALGIERPVLVGHSDGGSIALIHAGAFPGAVAGLVLMAPHVFVEDCSIRAIEEARRAFDSGGLDKRLARWHRDAAGTFDAWNLAWLDPRFRDWNIENYLAKVRAPLLAFQGEADPYGTRAQTDRIAAQVSGPADIVLLPDCGHAPWREASETVVPAVTAFTAGLAGGYRL